MLNPRIFARRGHSVGSISIFVQFFAYFGFIFLVRQYLQIVRHEIRLPPGLCDGPRPDPRSAGHPRPGRLGQSPLDSRRRAAGGAGMGGCPARQSGPRLPLWRPPGPPGRCPPSRGAAAL